MKMKRELKFKIRDVANKKWVTSKSFSTMRAGDDSIVIFMGFGNEDYNLQYVQYTGLNDKNGKEIYEGDILHFYFDDSYDVRDENLVCLYDSSNAWFNFYDKIEDHDNSYYWLEIRDYVEIIGNVFDNPELLEG